MTLIQKSSNIYFDHNSTTPLNQEVWAPLFNLVDQPMNPSAVHDHGRISKSVIENAREHILDALHADKNDYQVVFTSCATEANNLALKGLDGYRVFTTSIEHPSVFNVVGEGIIPVKDSGVIDLDALEQLCKSLNGGKFLASVMAVNNETGVIQPITEAAEIVHKYGGLIHSDAVQAFGKIHFEISNLDMVTISSHKIGGPFGAAALVARKSLPLNPLLEGGGQENRLRSGTHNSFSIYAFGLAANIAIKNIENFASQTQRLREYIESELLKIAPDAIIYGKNANRIPNTTSITMPNVPNETQIIHFDLHGFSVSAGSACSSNRLALPRVQMSMGYPEKVARTSIRISLGISNTMEQAKKFVDCWRKLYETVNNKKKVA